MPSSHYSYDVAQQGGPFSNSHLAATELFWEKASRLDRSSVSGVLQAVEHGHADQGVIVTLNNSTGVPFQDTYGELAERGLVMTRQLRHRIRHQLVGARAESIIGLRGRIDSQAGSKTPVTVASHYYALDGCKNWLNANLPGVTLVASDDTANTARDIANSRNSNTFAIAPREAARYYALAILARDINDHPENATTFSVVSRAKEAKFDPAADQTAMVVECLDPDQPGNLLRMVREFGLQRSRRRSPINLTRINSHPVENTHDHFSFFIDVDAGIQEPRLLHTIDALRKHGFGETVVGSYVTAAVTDRLTGQA